MIQRYDGQQARRLKMALVADNVYCIVSEPLKKLHPGKTPLNSVEIWMAAHGLTCDLIESPAPELIFDDLVEELQESVSGFKFQDSDTTVFLILMVSMCQISALREKIKNADALLKLLMNVCHQHEMYYKVLEQFDGKEISLRMAGKKIDLLTYEMKAVGDNKEEKRQMLDGFAKAALMFGPRNIESNLLVLNYYNLKNGHIWDDQIMELYGQLEKKSAIQKGMELIMGNKNVAENGGVQMNGDMPQDVAGFIESLNSLKLLGSGK